MSTEELSISPRTPYERKTHALATKNMCIGARRVPEGELKDDPSEVSCTNCIANLDTKQVKLLLDFSSRYAHSAKKGIDLERKMPEWAIIGFKSYTRPNDMIKWVFNSENPSRYCVRAHFTTLAVARSLTPEVDQQGSLYAFRQCWSYVMDKINANTSAHYASTIGEVTLSVYKRRATQYVEIQAVSVESDLGYLTQYILSIIVGKMANIYTTCTREASFNSDIDMNRLMSQIFSNQSNPRQENYRALLRVLLSGEIEELYNDMDEFKELFPQFAIMHDYSMYDMPNWLSINRIYKSEIDMIEGGLYV